MTLEGFWRLGCLLAAGLILPLSCFAVFRSLGRSGLPSPPRWEFFSAFGVFGGWLLSVALSPSPLGLLCATFTAFVALPVALFFMVRSAFRPRSSSFHRAAFGALCAGVGIPVVSSVLAAVLSAP